MVVAMSRNRTCMQRMRQFNIHSRIFFFFSLGGRGLKMEFFNSCVPIMFSNSQWVS